MSGGVLKQILIQMHEILHVAICCHQYQIIRKCFMSQNDPS